MLAFSLILASYLTWELTVTLLTVALFASLSNPILSRTTLGALSVLRLNNASFLLVTLTTLTFFWGISYRRYLTFNKSGAFLNVLVLSLVVVLLVFFYINKLLVFYIAFELSILPIFLIILGWGYQSERLSARLRMIFYTLRASMPLLTLLVFSQQFFSIIYMENFFALNRNNTRTFSIFSIVFFLLAFAVKLPIFGVHLWLPKAHVEAPVLGSIILAAILLKLGSYGLWLFFQITFSFSLINIWISISLIGAILVRLLCLRLRDIKIIIAYSSVRHIGMLIAALSLNNFSGAFGSIRIILAHGATSSAIFLIAFFMYQANHSRSLLLTKGILGWRVSLPLLWFLVLMSNMAAPPTFNLLAELLLILNLTLARTINIVFLTLIILIGTAYSLIIYSSSIQGRIINFCRVAPATSLTSLRIFNHLFWRFFIILSIETIIL